VESGNKVNLNIGQITKPMVADLPERLTDLLEIAAYVYAADQFVSRGGSKMRTMGADWRRTFVFWIPVRDKAFWARSDVLECLERTLTFLSEDQYEFHFVEAQRPRELSTYLELGADAGAAPGFQPDRVALFSGGIDSLGGAASALLKRGERIALVSHCGSTWIQSRQTELVTALKQRGPPANVFHVGVAVNKGREDAREFTQRARSFLFASLATVVARLFGKSEITFYENGIVSLNLPYAAHVVGSRATRTTHPKVLSDLSDLFGLVTDGPFKVVNPFLWTLKSEILTSIRDCGCDDLIAGSFSCTRVQLRTGTRSHCGLCSQCLERRTSVLAAGLEGRDPADGYATDLMTGTRNPGVDVTLALSFVNTALMHEKLSHAAFFGRYPEALRMLRAMDGSPEENAIKVYELHRRHGQEVREIVDAELIKYAPLKARRSLPPSCLISLLQSPFGEPVVRLDHAETEPAPAAFAQSKLGGLNAPSRPIQFSIDRSRRRVTLAGVIEFRGKIYQLLAELLSQFLGDLGSDRPGDDFTYVSSHALCKNLGVQDHSLRQLIVRLRKKLASEFTSALGVAIAADDVVQTDRWHGYRLNPFLSIVAPSTSSVTPDTADVTSSEQMSQLRSAVRRTEPTSDT